MKTSYLKQQFDNPPYAVNMEEKQAAEGEERDQRGYRKDGVLYMGGD